MSWYFGDLVTLEYIYRPGGDHMAYPEVAVNGEVVSRGKIPADKIVKYLEDMGAERLD